MPCPRAPGVHGREEESKVNFTRFFLGLVFLNDFFLNTSQVRWEGEGELGYICFTLWHVILTRRCPSALGWQEGVADWGQK